MLEDFLHQAKRVFQVARKPDQSEYLDVAKITAVGITLIGVIGFIIQMVRFIVEGYI
ncbi:MAG: protein translocase SEC61 complex subunit gamma [Candidatus Hadarchaeota archaeon]